MVICFECNAVTKGLLDSLIARGHYAEYSEAIDAAIHNLSVLENAAAKGALVFSATEKPALGEANGNIGKAQTPIIKLTQSGSGTEDHGEDAEIPKIFLGSNVTADAPADLPDAGPNTYDDGEVSIDKWIFGQFSKLLPAKASCRALANLTIEQTGGFDLNKVTTTVASEAGKLMDWLSVIDRREGFVRDEALVLGFPSKGQNADKSRLRYANQYVGGITKGRLTGILADLKLAALDSRSKLFQLTQAGWQFAALKNPVIDQNLGERLSHDEIEFLLTHIRESVPAEIFAYKTILNAIDAGANTPERLDDECKKYIPAHRKDELSDAFITTQRTGVVSRMNELGLIGRKREGIRVSYFITERGKNYD